MGLGVQGPEADLNKFQILIAVNCVSFCVTTGF